jgi:AcrR family transcriptional regulator
MLTPVRKGSDYHHGDLRSATIVAARKIVEKQGLQALGIRRLALQIGVTPPSLYRHFESLEDLQQELSTDIRREIGEFMIQRRDKLRRVSSKKQNEIAKFRSLGDSYIEYARLNPNLFQAAFFSCEEKLIAEFQESSWNALQQSLENFAALKLMSKKDSIKTSLLAWSAVHGIAMLVAQGAISPREFTSTKNSVLDSVLDAILKR